MRVVIVGGGLAGPCLAHGLRKAGIEVAPYERAAASDVRGQGYRIHIREQGDRALGSCLPANLYELVHATSGRPGSRLTVLSSQLEAMHAMDTGDGGHGREEAGTALSVDRVTFRRVLLAGLEETVHYGTAFHRFELRPDGTVRAVFTDGSQADADLLVSADGCGSGVRAQLLPDAQVVDTGQWAIFGKTPLTAQIRNLVPAEALDGFAAVVGSGGRYLPLAGLEYRSDPNTAAARLSPGLHFGDTRDYVMWVLGAPSAAFGEPAGDLSALDGAALRDHALQIVADWGACAEGERADERGAVARAG
jgi:2-polyprenyl-6-methoxyphenol hydroxylase-like FAD-dependent oxidoreductase